MWRDVDDLALLLSLCQLVGASVLVLLQLGGPLQPLMQILKHMQARAPVRNLPYNLTKIGVLSFNGLVDKFFQRVHFFSNLIQRKS